MTPTGEAGHRRVPPAQTLAPRTRRLRGDWRPRHRDKPDPGITRFPYYPGGMDASHLVLCLAWRWAVTGPSPGQVPRVTLDETPSRKLPVSDWSVAADLS